MASASSTRRGPGQLRFPQEGVDGHAIGELPSWPAWLGLLGVCTWPLDRRLRAREVVW